jgi:hypothetical protein
MQRATLTEPLRRFKSSDFEQVAQFKAIAKAIAKQTNIMVASILSDETIPDWKRAGDYATPQQLADLSIFCSDCLVQFVIKDLGPESALGRLDAGLIADIFDLVRVMYGDFATGDRSGRLTFEESLRARDIEDPHDVQYLTRLIDQLMDVSPASATSQNGRKVEKLRVLFDEHRRSFAYTLHTALHTLLQ